MGRIIRTKTIIVKIETSHEEKHQIITGNSILALGKIRQRFDNEILFYEKDGYVIKDKNESTFSFTAEKEFEDFIED